MTSVARGSSLEIDLLSREVHVRGVAVNLHGRAFDLLAMLAGAPERVFPPAELLQGVWPRRRIDDSNLRMQVQTLRKALGPDSVLNIPGRGYKLGMSVRLVQARGRAGNLPSWAGALFGREADSTALDLLLRSNRLVTVVGASGIGKTRLAHHLVKTDQHRHRDGAWWIDLAKVPVGAAVEAAVAQALAQALDLQTGSLLDAGAARSLASTLSGWHALLLLDNAEHLSCQSRQLATFVQTLLEASEGLHLLVTSQQRLELPAEQVYRLGTLAVPPATASPAEARASPALQLLERQARAVHHDYTLADEELPLAVDLVRRLDGVALAIEMAGARLPLLGIQDLHDRLTKRLLSLDGYGHHSGARHSTLRAALDWSHGLLLPAEQAVLRRLSVFAGPFSLHLAVQVVSLDDMHEDAALSAIEGLADKSWLHVDPARKGGAPVRFRLLESTRLYAEQALRDGGAHELAVTQRRHVLAVARLADRARDSFFVSSDADWSDQWLPDYNELALGFDRAHAQADVESASRIIELLVLGANITGRVEPALARASASRELARGAPPLPRARLLGWGSNLPRSSQSRVAAAWDRVAVWREVPPDEGRAGLCTSLSMLALALEEAGKAAAADAALAECLRLELPGWSPRLRRRCGWIVLSRMVLTRDDPGIGERADALSRQLVAQLAEMGAWRECLIVQAHQAQVIRHQGQPLLAAEMLLNLSRRRLALGCELDAGISMGLASAALVDAAWAREEPALWSRAGGAALEALVRIAPLPALIRHFLEPLSLLVCQLGDPMNGAVLLAGAERLRDEHQYRADRTSAHAARRVRELLDRRLASGDRTLAQAQGRSLDLPALRLVALRWLQRHQAGGGLDIEATRSRGTPA